MKEKRQIFLIKIHLMKKNNLKPFSSVFVDRKEKGDEIVKNPEIKLKRTNIEKVLDILIICLFIGSIIYLGWYWATIPDQVPAHYNALGEVNRWGGKGELLIIPILGMVMWVGLTILEKFPHVHNYINLTKDNVAYQYRNSQLMLFLLKNIIAVMFIFLFMNSIRTSLGLESWMGGWFLPTSLVSIFGTLGFFIWRSFRK